MREGEASTTARVVAAARLRSPREPAEGGRPDDDERLARDVAGDLVDRPTMLERHLAARTAFVDRALVRALDGGCGRWSSPAPGTTAERCATPGPGCAGSNSTIPTPSGTSASAWPGWASRRRTSRTSRPTSALANAVGRGSRLGLTASTAAQDPRARERRARLRAAVAALDEPMLSCLSAADLDALLERAGWRPDSGFDPAARAQGFLLAVRTA